MFVRGGGQHFSNKSEIQKGLKYPKGGGVKPILEKVHNFPVFNYDTSPKYVYSSEWR